MCQAANEENQLEIEDLKKEKEIMKKKEMVQDAVIKDYSSKMKEAIEDQRLLAKECKMLGSSNQFLENKCLELENFKPEDDVLEDERLLQLPPQHAVWWPSLNCNAKRMLKVFQTDCNEMCD